jgi:hypothetical protein
MKSVEDRPKPHSLRLFISNELKIAAEAEAKRRGVSLAKFVRRAIEKDIPAVPSPKEKP